MSLWSGFLTNKDRVIHKWFHYFPIYERFFERFRNTSIVFIEVGVYKGGSLKMWKQYFGPFATIVGLDINPACKKYEEDQIFVRIDDQKDRCFLREIIEEFGNPDIMLDDCSHKQLDIWETFDEMFPRVKNNGIYFVEDLHTSYRPDYGGGLRNPQSFIERSKVLIDELNGYHHLPKDGISEFTSHTFSICYFDSIIVFEKMTHIRPGNAQIGNPNI